MSQLWHLLQLWQLILYYVTFMTISRRQSRHFLSKKMLEWTTHLGYHVDGESQQLDRLVQWMTWTCGSWDLHTVFQTTSCVCDECPWHAVNQTRSYSGRIWSPMIWATFSDRRVSLFPHFFPHLDACCDSTLTCCKFPSVAQSMPMAPKLALNTIQKEAYAQPCA